MSHDKGKRIEQSLFDHGQVADLPTMPPIETRHFLIFGGVGSGKTQTIFPLMRAARREVSA